MTPSISTLQESKPDIPKNVKELFNDELRSKVIKFANNMRDFENNFMKEELESLLNREPLKGTEEEKAKQWNQQTIIYIQRKREYDNEFRKRFLGEAIIYRDELIRRLNIMPPKRNSYIDILFKDILAGPYLINEMATYLENMDRQLPEGK